MSRIVQDQGWVVHTLRYSDTSLIVTWLTREHGILKTLAKGALRPKSRWAGHLDAWIEGELIWKASPTTHLHTLTDFHATDRHESIRTDYAKSLFLSYSYELISQLAEAETPVNEFYDLFGKCIHYLHDHTPSFRLMERLHAQIMHLSGLTDGGDDLLLHAIGKWPKTKLLLERELRKTFSTKNLSSQKPIVR